MAKSAVPTKKHDTEADSADQKLTKGMRSEGHQYEEAEWENEKTPPEGDLGFSKYEVGNQDNAEAPAAEEGARAIEALLENGHIDKHEKFDSIDRNAISGFEK